MILALRYRHAWLAFVLALAAGILVVSLLPARVVSVVNVWDKLEHSTAYLLLALAGAGIVERRGYVAVAGLAVLFGALVEVAQGTLTTTRMMDWHDVVANAAGIAVALLLAYAGLGGWARRVEAWLGAR